MLELVTADRPAIVCLQEVPAWALGIIGGWVEMNALGDRTRRGRPFGRRVTSLNAGFFRSSFNGQGNAILVPRDWAVRAHKSITLNTNPFVEEEGRKLGLDPKIVRWWERERRLCQLVKLERPDRRRVLVANVHATSIMRDARLADSELHRATNFADRQSEVEEVVVFAGDFNITQAQSQTIAGMLEAPPESRWSAGGPNIDHVFVRGAKSSKVRVWPDDERRYNGNLLSDHAPVEVEIDA